jgi:hypothetical protein
MQLDSQTTSEVRPTASKGAIWTGRVISGLIGLFMLQDGILKAIKLPMILKYCAKYGLNDSMIQGIGVTLLICTVIYLIPRTTVLGAILLTGYLGGAILLHLRFGDPVFAMVFAFIFGVLVWLGIFLREPKLWALIPFRG